MNMCIYQHIRLDTNEVFYIGIGSKYRARCKNGRNKYWKEIVETTKYKVEILSNNLSYENAQESEIQLIKLYGRKDLNEGPLVNLNNGGSGNFGINISKETRLKQSIAKIGKKQDPEVVLKRNLSISRGNCYKARKVINILTNKIYDCIQDAAEDNNLKYKTLKCYLCGSTKNKTPLRYYE